jgi:hypothetical protein
MTQPVTFLQAAVPSRLDGIPHTVVHWGVGALTAAAGLIGVIHNTRPHDFHGPGFGLPLVFGMGMATFIGLSFFWHQKFTVSGPVTRTTLVRSLSRLVYLTLYLLIGTNQALAVLNHHALAASATRLQGYLIAGILGLVVLRVLAFTVKAA